MFQMGFGLRFLQDGGGFMYLNLLVLVCALAVVGERLYVLVLRDRLDADAFMTQITKLVSSGNLDRAIKFCAMTPEAPLARVMRAGLSSHGRGERDVARSFDEAILSLTPGLTARLGWLWSLANLATLVGVVGTLTRAIAVVHSLHGLPEETKQRLLGDGISAATNNILFGLAIAVACVLAHRSLTSLGKKLIGRVELAVGKVENQLGRARPIERSA